MTTRHRAAVFSLPAIVFRGVRAYDVGFVSMIAFVRPAAPLNRYIQNVPLNYIHLAAWLRAQGHASLILDAVFDEITPQFIDRAIREGGVTIVGIGCMTCEFPQAIAEAARLKQSHPGLVIVFGGAHPSGDPEECLRSGVVDYVVVGEGEIPLGKLLDSLRDGLDPCHIPGLWRMRDGAVVPGGAAEIPVVDDLPRPAYDMLNLERYFRLDSPWHFPKSSRAVQFITERGCPYQCSYCHEIHTKKFRGMRAEIVLDLMEWLVREQGVREFMIVDDIFNFDLERAKSICRGIVERGLRIHLQFPNGVRGDRFDEELVALMKRAGTHYMAVAIETVSEKHQKLVRKNLGIAKARQTIDWAGKYGIEVSGFFMIGFPGETLDEVQATLRFAVEAPLDSIFVSIVAPFKGTRLRTDMEAGTFGQLSGDGVSGLSRLFPIVHNAGLSPGTLERLQRQAYWRFYTKPRSLIKLGSRMTSIRNVRKVARAVARRVRESRAVSVN
jgi:anaerobic magnesium-protoporphyrin IX monomethyl ester cyclase